MSGASQLVRNLKSFDRPGCEVGIQRINCHSPLRRNHHQIHVFHGNSSKQYFVAQDHSTNITLAILKLDMNRTHVGAKLATSISSRHFFFGTFTQLKLRSDVVRDAQKKSAGIG